MSHSAAKPLRLTLAGLAVVAAAGWTVPSLAFRMIQNNTTGRITAGSAVSCNAVGGFLHWTQSFIAWRHNPAGQGSGKAAALQSAMATWTNVANADHTLSYAGTTNAGFATDGINTVLWSSGNGCTGTCLALTALVVEAGQVIVESDITFNSSVTWTTNGNPHDTQAVATHELGHALGIHHTEITTTPRPTMFASYNGADGRSLELDDVSALQCAQSRFPFSGGANLPAPSVLDVAPDFCLGWATMTWTSVPGATSYELERTSSTFGFSSIVFQGPGLSFYENGGTGTKTYRVRACDASACSAYWRDGDQGVGYYLPCQ